MTFNEYLTEDKKTDFYEKAVNERSKYLIDNNIVQKNYRDPENPSVKWGDKYIDMAHIKDWEEKVKQIIREDDTFSDQIGFLQDLNLPQSSEKFKQIYKEIITEGDVDNDPNFNLQKWEEQIMAKIKG